MTRYELLKFLHVSSAIIWLGAGFLLAVLIFGAEREGDVEREGAYHRDVGWLAPRLFIPFSLATLVFGLLLVADGPYGFDQVWISIALVGWLASFLVGILYFKPEGEWIGQSVAERGPGDPEIQRRLRRLNIVDRFQVTVLFTVVADMVIRPTGDDAAVLIVGAAIIAAFGAMSAISIRAGAEAGAEAHSMPEPALDTGPE